MDYSQLYEKLPSIALSLWKIVKEAGIRAKEQRSQFIPGQEHDKPDKSLVTAIDLRTEAYLIEQLSQLLPGSTFIAEESSTGYLLQEGVATWIIDPIDGTTNMVHNLPGYAVSVALYLNKTPILGAVYDIGAEATYWASAHKDGAFKDDERIYCSKTSSLEHALLATGFPSLTFTFLDQYLSLVKYFMQNTRGLRRIGAASLDLVYTAEGRFDSFFETDLKPWDVAAGAFILQKAGGKATTFVNGDDFLFGTSIVASTASLHQTMLDSIRDYYK